MINKKVVMVIPSYWRREERFGIQESDVIYDHPTPLDQEGTIKRAIDSIKILNYKDFELIIIGVANAEDIETKVEEKLLDILFKVNVDISVYLFSHSHLKNLYSLLKDKIGEDLLYLLSLKGYPSVRNMCIFLAHAFDSDVVILIDDDEVFEDPYFMEKALEFIGEETELGFIGVVAGYYLQADGTWRLKPKKEHWTKYWDNVDRMNEAFELVIGRGPRLKETPFVFGGNMVIHRKIFEQIPFDPDINRGEDIDFLINMRMFNYKCYLDNILSIKHLPPPKPYPVWKQIREDIYRFIFEREKLRNQKKIEGMHYVTAAELDPYPGAFLRDDLEEKIYKTSHALSEYYKCQGMEDDAKEALRNIEIADKNRLIKRDPFIHLLSVRNDWERLIKVTSDPDLKREIRACLQKVK